MARGKKKNKAAEKASPEEVTEETTEQSEVETVDETEGDLLVDDNPDEVPFDPEAEAVAAEIAEAEAAASQAKRGKVKAEDVRNLAAELGATGTGRLKLEVLERLAAQIDDNDNPYPDAEDAAAACVLALENSTLQSYQGTVKKIQQGGNE